MGRDDIPAPVRELELGPGFAIWRVHLDRLREQDVNARIMGPDKFQRLVANIKSEGGLYESLPLCAVIPDQPDYFQILSGHHRTRAARSAGETEIFVIVVERELTDDEITAKQLAHNALAGEDDPDILARLFASIQSPDAKLESGLSDLDISIDVQPFPVDGMFVEYSFEAIYILWMSADLAKWEHLLEKLQPDARMYLADHEAFAQFSDQVKRIGKLQNIRNIAGIMVAMMKYAELGMQAEAAAQAEKEKP